MTKTIEAKGTNVPGNASPTAAKPAAKTPAKPTTPITGTQLTVPPVVDPLLSTILTWPRPHGSYADARFREWLTQRITALPHKGAVATLAEGVIYASIPNKDGRPSTTLFSCHIDTVDAAGEGAMVAASPGAVLGVRRKALTYDPNFGLIELDDKSPVGTCLGADDGVGVWIMLNMMDAGIPGGYIFHTGEECGGVGSRAVLAKHIDILKKYEVAVAFDRPRDNEVITHQGGARCASDKMGVALAAALTAHGLDYVPSTKGVFTDTKVYRGVIAECLNIGVGYEHQHGRNETQDYGHAVALLAALIKLDWDALPVDRDPSIPDPVPAWSAHRAWDDRSYYGKDLFDDVAPRPAKPTAGPKPYLTALTPPKAKGPTYAPASSVYEEMAETTLDDVIYTCEAEPAQMAETVMDLVIEIGQLRAECAVLRAMLKREN